MSARDTLAKAEKERYLLADLMLQFTYRSLFATVSVTQEENGVWRRDGRTYSSPAHEKLFLGRR